MSGFVLDNPCGRCVLDASTVPIYDTFISSDARWVWWIGPAYARKALLNVEVRINDAPTEWEEIRCRWNFTFQARASISRGCQSYPLHTSLHIFGGPFVQGRLSIDEVRPRGFLAAQTLAKYDWPYVGEWIEHHRAVGIEHFFIYNNGEPRLTEALRPYVAQGIVTEIPWPYPYKLYPVGDWEPWWPNDSHLYTQPPATMHCLRKYGPNWDWMWCGDCDEFLNPRMPLPEILECAGSGWSLKGKWFGNAGLREVPASLRCGYTRAESGLTSAAKLIVRPRDVLCYEVHQCQAVGHIIDMPAECLYFHHYRAASDHYARRSPDFDNEYTNEVEDRSLCPKSEIPNPTS